jgi:patatin-like phospholipase/acyl hydrolase
MKKILQIDGGGIRGIIPAVILAYLEENYLIPLTGSVASMIVVLSLRK